MLENVPQDYKSSGAGMGYAYSLGIIDELRKAQVKFARFYIFAPENAGSSEGEVKPSEWDEVFQYGADNSKPYCWRDVTGYQEKANGLPDNKRIFIPKKVYSDELEDDNGNTIKMRDCFNDAHFIGYYIWVFTEPNGQIKSRK